MSYNRLSGELSPYLLQHKDNPVHWQPWSAEAFEEARRRDCPVFLSIGYSTCHWCHVMEHESFEDDSVAALLNEQFVSIKVDREERPDLDAHYMSICQSLTGQGGWPLTIVMDPEGQAFFAGTYFPQEQRYGRPGMLELLPALAGAWRDERGKVRDTVTQIRQALERSRFEGPAGKVDPSLPATAASQLLQRFDAAWGGFGGAPRFPTPQHTALLLAQHARTPRAEMLHAAEKTLQEMRRGGLYDQVGHGFHRYSTDGEWRVPHFEKMLYDQALLLPVYCDAWQQTGRPFYEDVIRETCGYVIQRMRDPAGGFHSAEDADSEGEEGRFYTWKRLQLLEAAGEEGELFCQAYGVDGAGNWAGESGREEGLHVLRLPGGPGEGIRETLFPPGTDLEALEKARRQVFASRETRPHPLLDDKVLCDWNGMMIAALARAGVVLEEPAFHAAAVEAAEFVLREMRDEQGGLLHRWRKGQAGIPAMLMDHAALIGGLLALYQADFDPRWLREALRLQQECDSLYLDRDHGGYFMTAAEYSETLPRQKDFYDGALPAGNSLALENLVQLARLTARPELEQRAHSLAGRIAAEAALSHNGADRALCALDHLVNGGSEIVLCAPDRASAGEMLQVLDRRFLPFQVRLLKTHANADALHDLTPWCRAMQIPETGCRVYLCEDFSCSAPLDSPEALEGALGR